MDFEKFHRDLEKEKVYSCLINTNSRRVYEYYKNKKQVEKLHKLNSCTKSVISILIGIALDKGLLTSIDMSLPHFFPKLLKEQTNGRKKDIQIKHLLTMTDGFDFPEFGEWNCFSPMVYYHDIVKFVVERPLIHQPGIGGLVDWLRRKVLLRKIHFSSL